MVLNETIPGLLPLQSGGARRTLDKLIEKHGTKLFNCFEAGYSTFGGIQSIIFLPPLHKFAEIDPNDATRPVTINKVVYRVAKIKDFRTLPETAQTAPNFFLYKFIEELVQHFDYGVGMTGVEPPEFSSNFPGLDNPTKTKYDNDCFALLEITCRLYSIFYITIYAQQDLCLENNMRSGLYSRYVENRTTQPQFSVFMDEIIHALQSGESLQCLFGQNETNRDALEVLLEMMLEHGLLYTAAKLGLPIEKIKTLTGTRFFTGTTDFLEKVMAKFPVVEGAPLPPPLPPSPPIPSTPPTSPTSPTSPPPPPPPAVIPTEDQISAVLEGLLYSTDEGLTWTRIPQSKVTEFIGGADKSLNITSEIVNTVLRDKGKKFGIPLVIFDDTINIISKDRFDRPYNILANQWCFYYSILEQFDVDRKVRKENTVIKARLDGQTNVTPNTKRDTPNFIKSIKEALQDKKLYANEKEQWKLFYESQPGKKYDEYIASLDDARTKPWADPEYGIGQVIANKFRANINIYQTKTDGNYINLQTYTPKEVQMQDPVHILYINRNHYQILLPKTGAVVPAPPPSPVSDTFTLKIEKGEIYPTRLHFTDTLDNINPYRTKILLKQESTGIPAPNGWAAIEKRFIPNQIYLRKINTMDYLTKNAEASWTEISKLFTPTNYIAINEVTMEFIDRGEHTSTNEANWVRRSRPRDSYGYKNPAAAERSKSGGTRKRHHSYPLKHTFKNRRA